MKHGLILCALIAVATAAKSCTHPAREPAAPDSSVNAQNLSGESDTFEEMVPPRAAAECGLPKKDALFETSDSVVAFVRKLQSFIHETRFDVRAFEQQGRRLATELARFRRQTSKIAHGEPSADLRYKLDFASHLFSVMGDAIELLKHYEAVRTPGHNFVWSVIDLNVRLFGLFDADGVPDYLENNYAIRVYRQKQHLKFLKECMDASANVPFGTDVMFVNQYSQAEGMLHFLATLTMGETN